MLSRIEKHCKSKAHIAKLMMTSNVPDLTRQPTVVRNVTVGLCANRLCTWHPQKSRENNMNRTFFAREIKALTLGQPYFT